MRLPNPSLWSRLVAVGLPFYKSEARRRALGALAVLFALLLAINGMNVVNSYVGRDFMSALAERHAREFFVEAGVLAGVFAVSTVVEVLARYAEQWLGLVWRQWLTRRLLDRYLAGRAYLRLAEQHDIDNPDERISEDVKTFTATTLSILVLLVNGLLTLAAFSWVLWSITPWLLATALGYAMLGSFGTILLGRRLASPRFAFLENPAETVGAPLAERLYQALARSPIGYVSVGCPPALLPYHDRRLELKDDGSWQVESVESGDGPAP